MLIGQAIDYHSLIKRKGVIHLGGYKFNSNYQVVAHSDGDVVLHAISNALLGALGQGDIGDYFSDQKKSNKNLESQAILDYCLYQANKKHKIVNIDLTIICDRILLQEKKCLIRNCLISLTKCRHINVKATRFESNSNQIACSCVVLIKEK